MAKASSLPIDHEQRAGRLWPILVSVAKQRSSITYGDAAHQIGIHWRPMSYALSPIQDYCLEEGLPRLTGLVLGRTTGLPGGGYLGTPGNKADLEEVYDFDWSRIANPFSLEARDKLDEVADDIFQNPSTAPNKWVRVLSRGDVQRVFRATVLKAYGYRCAICSNGFYEVLEAAHIIPWASERRELRADPRNGICLCANHHRLFDAGRLQIGSDYIVRFDDPDMDDGDYDPSDIAATVSFHDARLRLPQTTDLKPLPELLKLRQER